MKCEDVDVLVVGVGVRGWLMDIVDARLIVRLVVDVVGSVSRCVDRRAACGVVAVDRGNDCRVCRRVERHRLVGRIVRGTRSTTGGRRARNTPGGLTRRA